MENEINQEAVPCVTKEPRHEDTTIFRAPRLLFQTKPEAFQPQVVSIGPYHHKHKDVLDMNAHKRQVFELFLKRANTNRTGQLVSMSSLSEDVGHLSESIRNSYSEHLQLSQEEVVNMMIMDGCFILMVVLVAAKNFSLGHDTIFSVPWILPAIRRDFLLLENQIPYTVLETLFATLGDEDSLERMVCRSYLGNLFSMRLLNKVDDVTFKPRHLLHLIWKIVVDSSPQPNRLGDSRAAFQPKFILPATKLQFHGIELKVKSDANTILEVGVKEGNKLVIPHLILDEFAGMFLSNCVALEQASRNYRDVFSSYVVFMGFLMKDKEDISLICNERIIQNCFGTNEEASDFFKNMAKHIVLHPRESHLTPMIEVINAYTSNRGSRYWAELKRNVFSSPWVLASSIAALFIILIAVAQLVVAVLSYKHDLK